MHKKQVMIQRIQTVYFLISEMLIGLLFFVPFAEIAGTGSAVYRFDMDGLHLMGVPKPEFIISGQPLVFLSTLVLLFVISAIFRFKNRKTQIWITIVNIFFLLVLWGLMFYDVLSGAKSVSGIYSFRFYFTFPLIAVVFNYMAIRAIKKDEMLVRSVDRIR